MVTAGSDVKRIRPAYPLTKELFSIMAELDIKSIPELSQIIYPFERPIAFHPVFVDATGSITAALFLSQALYWSKRTKDKDRWFYKKQCQWEDETKLSRKQQETARRDLRKLGVIEEKLVGIPAVLHFRINFERLTELIVNVQTRLPQTDITVCPKRTSQYARNGQSITEITTKTTPGIINTVVQVQDTGSPNGSPDPSPSQLAKRQTNPFADYFLSKYQHVMGSKYVTVGGDYKQLSELRKQLKGEGDDDGLSLWQRAVDNLFISKNVKFTMRFLVSEFNNLVAGPRYQYGYSKNEEVNSGRLSFKQQEELEQYQISRALTEYANRRADAEDFGPDNAVHPLELEAGFPEDES